MTPDAPRVRTGLGKKLVFSLAALVLLGYCGHRGVIDGAQFVACFLALVGGFLGAQAWTDRAGAKP